MVFLCSTSFFPHLAHRGRRGANKSIGSLHLVVGRCVCDNGFIAFAPPVLTNAIHDDGILASTSFVVTATPLQSYGAVNRTS